MVALNWLSAIFGLLIAIGISIYLIGLSIPSQQTADVEIEIHAPVEHVWDVITAWKDQPKWRTSVSKVEINSPYSFTEYPTHGNPITFHVVSASAPRQLELKMSGAVTGSYVVHLNERAGVAVFSASEVVSVENPIMRVISRITFDLETFAKRYAIELKRYAESPP